VGLYEEAERGTAAAAGGDPETVPAVRTTPVTVAGRITRHRSQGKVAFADIVDGSGKLQLYAREDELGAAGKAAPLGDR